MNKKEIGRYYAIALIVTAFIGSKVLSINIGVQLSLYRMLLIIAPVILSICPCSIHGVNCTSKYTKLLKRWAVYSIVILPIVCDYMAWGRNMFFLLSALATSYIAGLYIRREKDIYIILMMFVMVMSFDAVIGVREMITGVYHYVPEGMGDSYDIRSAIDSTLGIRVPISVAGNPNDFGMMMVFAFIAAITMYRISENFTTKITYLICSIFFLFMVVASQSRSQFLSLLIALAFYSYFFYKKQSKTMKAFIIIGILLSATTVIGWLVANKDLYMALIEIDISGNDSDSVRWNLIKNGISVFLNGFCMGVGVGNIEYHLAKPGLLNTDGIVNIHNWWLEILVSSGLFVFVIYMKYYLNEIKYFYKTYKNQFSHNIRIHNISLCGFASLVVFSLSSLGSSSIFSAEWVWAYFVLMCTFHLIIDKRTTL